ncbi:MAG: alpha/beta hydrolase [Candidatus Portnoybacteria bacterium]|nr:alpha/beta hydrolase [Candidatus Portnoybacteria bacterium]MDD4982893.1 alpha/beta hydrolase [Candidatus Portnoybacteria bacterium]
MKKIALAVISFLLVASVALAETPIIIVGGVGSNLEQVNGLKDGIPGSIVIIPDKMWPLSYAAEELLGRIREAGVTEQFIVVAHSWGGLIARRIDADNPGLVEKIITIASPSGGFGPAFVRVFFDTGDKESKTPLYVIAAYNNSAPRFYMGTEKNDGVVDLKSALDLRGKKVIDQKVVEGEHTEVLNSQVVIQLVKSWMR